MTSSWACCARAGSTFNFKARRLPRATFGAGCCANRLLRGIHVKTFCVVFVSVGWTVGLGSAQTYTAQQAGSGAALYRTNCAGCHAADLAGRGEAPELAGRNFMRNWGTRSIADLVSYMQGAMPPTN